jgi:hypothetical protein
VRMRDMPADPSRPELPANELDLIMHVELALPAGSRSWARTCGSPWDMS